METIAWIVMFFLAVYAALLKNEKPPSEEEIILAEAEAIIKRNCLFDYDPEKHRGQLKHILETAAASGNEDCFDPWFRRLSKEEKFKQGSANSEAPTPAPEISAKKVIGISYVAIKGFSLKRTAGDFYLSAMEVISCGEPLIIDLRDNRGGIFDAAVDVISLFGKRNDVVVSQKYRKGKDKVIRAPEEGPFKGVRAAVLVNEWSASAAELFAGVLKEWGFPIVGQTTYGKGVGQSSFLLPDLSEFYLTTFEYFVGEKRVKVNKIGIEPDYRVPDSRKMFPGLTATAQDRQFMKAVEVLKKMK